MRESVRIAVVSASPGAGASFVCGCLAAVLRERFSVTVAELGHPYFYPALGMEKRFVLRKFTSCSELLKSGKSVRKLNNIDDGINWALMRPERDAAPEPSELFRLIYNLPGEVLILDCSGLKEELLRSALPEADKVVLVVDPMPTKLISAFPLLEYMRLRLPACITVINKMNKGVRKGELASLIGTKKYISMPCVPAELLYEAEYRSSLPWNSKAVSSLLSDALRDLVRETGL